VILKILLTVSFSLLAYLAFKWTGALGLGLLILTFGMITTWLPRRR
jgi:hypothetical protein